MKLTPQDILGQTFKDFEFLIINDGSTDKTGEILKSYNDPRIKIINNEKNKYCDFIIIILLINLKSVNKYSINSFNAPNSMILFI